MSKKLHIICGMCGSDSEWIKFSIEPLGACDEDGVEYPAVYIYCDNCGTLTDLTETIREIKGGDEEE